MKRVNQLIHDTVATDAAAGEPLPFALPVTLLTWPALGVSEWDTHHQTRVAGWLAG